MRSKHRRLNTQKIKIITLGCAKNLVDSEVMAAQLLASGYQIVHGDVDDAAVAIVNTCGFIDQAKANSRQTIDKYLTEKRRGRLERLYVTGCLSQRYPEKLAAEFPEVDGFFGTRDLPDLLRSFGADYKKELIGARALGTAGHYAYLKVSEGCSRSCSFCAIPGIRGKHISREADEIVQEAEHLIASGVREIMLIAQDLTYYGLDLYKERRLNDVLCRLSDIAGLEWLRLHYAHPASFPVNILKTMRERDNICKYLDIPFQHISSNMLKIMRRSTDRQMIEDLVGLLRGEVPGIHIRSTFLSGHPGETEEDHQELLDFLRTSRLDRVGVFKYSHEEGTHAFDMGDDVPTEIKDRRFDELMSLQQEISLEQNQAKVGSTMKVVIDGATKSRFVGRTEFDSPEVDNEILVTGNRLEIGQFYDVEITDAQEYDLNGRIR